MNGPRNRLTVLVRTESRKAKPTSQSLARLPGASAAPGLTRFAVTFDNGTEFARAPSAGGLPTFFCDPHAPWQKGGVENAIGRMRRFMPRKTDLATLSTRRFHQLIAVYNNTPRKCLDFRTPAESFATSVALRV